MAWAQNSALTYSVKTRIEQQNNVLQYSIRVRVQVGLGLGHLHLLNPLVELSMIVK